MLHLVRIPEDPEGVIGLLPAELKPADRTPCHINQ
jgi:hypothetical protein